jgi:phosphate-selective porin OprO and OprP
MKRVLRLAVIAAAVLPIPAAAQERGLVWDNRPSIVFGEDLNIDLKGRTQLDWRWFDPATGDETFDVRTIRLGLEGELTRHFDWEIEREIDYTENAEVVDQWQLGEWKDVYINWRTFDAFSVQAGRFKMPFGLEQTTSVSDLDFAYRTRGSVKIAPGRDRGVMAYGELFDGAMVYEAGVFDDDGDNGTLEEFRFVEAGQTVEDLAGVGPSLAVRVVGEIFRGLPVPERLKGAELGAAYTSSNVPEGLNSLQGEEVWGYNFFDRVYVNGRRQRVGFQFDWTPGPAGFKAEWMQSREERLGQSNRDEDLSDFIGTAWYTSATWILTGEDKDSNVTPRRPLFAGGIGVIEIGVRFDQLTFESASTVEPAFTNPRADTLVPNTDSTITFGVNWMPIRWVKVVGNALRQSFADVNRAPNTGVADYWSGLLRLQIAF